MALEITKLQNGEQIASRQMMIYTASISKTKSGKDYLMATVGNKTGKIEARMWTLPPNFSLPRVGTVYSITAIVTEFNGQKQLNIASMSKIPDSEINLIEYTIEVPSRVATSTFEKVIGYIREELIANDSQLLLRVFDNILNKYKRMMPEHTAACNVHHAGVGGWLKHTNEVVKYADAIYHNLPEHTSDLIRHDLLLLGAFLHDIGKLTAYGFESGVSVMTDTGRLLEHTCSGLLIVHTAAMEEFIPMEPSAERGKDDIQMLEHIIAAHHGELEYGAAVNPVTLEAHIVSTADKLSADLDAIYTAISEMPREEAWTQKIFTQHNRQFTIPVLTRPEVDEDGAE